MSIWLKEIILSPPNVVDVLEKSSINYLMACNLELNDGDNWNNALDSVFFILYENYWCRNIVEIRELNMYKFCKVLLTNMLFLMSII